MNRERERELLRRLADPDAKLPGPLGERSARMSGAVPDVVYGKLEPALALSCVGRRRARARRGPSGVVTERGLTIRRSQEIRA